MADSSQLILLLALERFNMADFATNPNKDLTNLEIFASISQRGWKRAVNVAINLMLAEDENWE